MSKENLSPREQAENIILRAMKKAEEHFNTAMDKEGGQLNRLDLVSNYSNILLQLSTALENISTEVPY